MKVTKLRICPLLLVAIIVSACGGPSPQATQGAGTSTASSTALGSNQPTQTSGSGTESSSAPGTSEASQDGGMGSRSLPAPSVTQAMASNSGTGGVNNGAPVESNVVILSRNGLIPFDRPGPVTKGYSVVNNSLQGLKVIAVEVVNDVGDSFTLGSTNCLQVLLPGAQDASCEVTVVDQRLSTSDQGRLRVITDNQAIGTVTLPGASYGRGGQSPDLPNSLNTAVPDPLVPDPLAPDPVVSDPVAPGATATGTPAPNATQTTGQVTR